jgi:hypothetical protein
VPKNIISYIYQYYIPRFIRRLTEKYNLYFGLEAYSSVITEEHFGVSFSELVSRRLKSLAAEIQYKNFLDH